MQASNIASGAVGSSQLAAGAVQASNIAPGTITSSQLAKPPQAGSIASSSLQHDYFQRAFTVSFSPAFTNTPIVTLGWQGSVPDGLLPALWVESSDAASFTGRFSPLFGFHTLDSAGFVGEYTSLAMVDGNPAISYHDNTNHELKFVRAPDLSPFTIQWIALEP